MVLFRTAEKAFDSCSKSTLYPGKIGFSFFNRHYPGAASTAYGTAMPGAAYLLHFRRRKALIFQIAVCALTRTARILLAAQLLKMLYCKVYPSFPEDIS